MFEPGQRIIYGGSGVCAVEELCSLDLCDTGEERLYYVLRPLGQTGIIYAPVDAPVFMRPILTEQEVLRLVSSLPQMPELSFPSGSLTGLSSHYEALLSTHDCATMLSLLLALYRKRRQASLFKKKFGQIDARFMRRTEDLLFGEFAEALSLSPEEVPGWIASRLEGKVSCELLSLFSAPAEAF
jgi:CarD family transcriptional regulator